MNPIEVSQKIQHRVRNSIRKSLPVERSVPAMVPILDQFFIDNPLAQDPFLELVPDYQPGVSLAELANEGVITERTAQIFANYFHGGENGDPSMIHLHEHQAQAIRNVCAEGKNLVVCSGTGSGKTEAFLIPLVDQLIREHQAGTLGDGVRAMILYPMNALVNDQIRRLRGVLRFAEEVRFGKFTGETETDVRIRQDLTENQAAFEAGFNQSTADGSARFGFDDEAALPNEVITRRRWRNAPAHIMVTNYAMLERLLLQPQSQGKSLFGAHWKHIVLDEAHCYSGALGTEIAWLIRRVKRRVEAAGTPPDNLRYIATSATLISDNITNEKKAERIRTEFASRLFPAPAVSFAVQFGTLRPVPNQGNGYNLTSAQMISLGDEELIRDSQNYLGRRDWHGKLQMATDAIVNDQQPVAVGDLLSVLRMANAAVKGGLLGGDLEPLENEVLSPNWAGIPLLLDFVRAGIGPLDQYATWREWMHEEGDPRPSSIPGDFTANGQQNPVGNRLHLLTQWSHLAQNLSLEAVEWLVACASELAVTAELDAEPDALAVNLPQAIQVYLQSIAQNLAIVATELQGEETNLNTAWSESLQQQGYEPQGEGFQGILASVLADHPTVLHLKRHLRGAVDNPDGADMSRMKAVAQALFPDDQQGPDALTALISLGILAKAQDQRTPVLDTRYHQLLRGVETPGLRLRPTPLNGGVDVELIPEVLDDSLALGLCRECGQPFALGYARDLQLGQLPLQLRSNRSGEYRYLHAFAWVRGDQFEDENNPGLLLNTHSGSVHNDPYQDPNSVNVIAHQGPGNNESPEFIAQCPACNESQQNYSGSRYGIITPYEASGPQVRVVALEELARLSDESADPAAQTHPGGGRKLLVFSDSRSGAATLAWRLQEYTAETTVARLIVEAVQGNPVQNLTDEEVLEIAEVANPQWVNLQAVRADLSPTAKLLSIIVRRKIEEYNLSGLLSVSRVEFNQQIQKEIPVGDLTTTEAARYRLVEALCKKGRNGILQRRLLKLTNQNLLNFQVPGLDMNSVQMEALLGDLILVLLGKIQLKMPTGFPSAELNQYRRTVSPNGINGTMPFITNAARSLLNRTVRIALVQYCDFWHQDLVNHLNALAAPGNAPALAQAIAEYPPDALRSISQTVCSSPQRRWIDLLVGQLPNGRDQPITVALREIRNFFESKAALLLDHLWGPFSNPNGLLVDIGNGTYQLDPMLLQILPGNDAGVMAAGYDNDEDAYLASRKIIPLRVEEHTAQIATGRGSAYQRAFANGSVNVLSCSTTFEMGVDLGDLNCVFLNGMPPAVANYRQRAGRAGRRPGSSSYALTFLGQSSHDRYYWEHPGQLLFGPMDAPKIYLENPMFCARHLRAEAMHHFLDWLQRDNRADTATQRFDVNGQVGNGTRRRKWGKTGDFFLGVAAGRAVNGVHPLKEKFRPLVAELPAWQEQEQQALQQYLQGIADLGELDYQVADDLVWQLLSQDDSVIQPYDNGLVENYRLLGGPHFPDADRIEPRRCELEHQAKLEFGIIPENHPRFITRHQNHFLHEETVSWLSRRRVLPKYGFPVDLIKLMPAMNDHHGQHVKMDRDLRIGLYEFAPGQVVTANKRRFKSAIALVFENGQMVPAGGHAVVSYLCKTCHEPDWSLNAQANQNCRFCGVHGQLEAVNLCRPDAFRAHVSTAGSGIPEERGTALHVHTGAFRMGIAVAGTLLVAMESNSGTITYINQGSRHQGFPAGDNARFALYHDIRTDIAGWMLSPVLFGDGMKLNGWERQNQHGRNRLNAAMKSALHAILRAGARVKGIEDRDLGGIVQPGIHQNGELGFVIFDEADGGGGAVLDFVLTGKPELDEPRTALVRRILEQAVRTCEACSCGFIIDSALMPIERLEFLALAPADQADLRPATSCYRCLRSHRNQREHALLDRYDAAQLLKEILADPLIPQSVITRQALVFHPNVPDAFDLRLDDSTTKSVRRMPVGDQPNPKQWIVLRLPSGSWAYGEWFLTERRQASGNSVKRLRLLNGVGLSDGILITEDQLPQLDIWQPTP
jgi:ATP-dependent helicase YprA (DUF1998 family)